MPTVEWTPQARAELKEVLKYIARQDRRPLTAVKIEIEIREKLTIYAANPDIGQERIDLPPECRCCIHKRWIVVYRTQDSGIQVTNVIDTARDFPKFFE